ncbi:MAG: hypothetical protein R3A43_06430 [Bacteroidia bacterium]
MGDYLEEKTFTIKTYPTSEATEADYIAKYYFLKEVVDKLDETHKAIEEMSELSGQISSFMSKQHFDKNDSIKLLADSIQKQLSSLKMICIKPKTEASKTP